MYLANQHTRSKMVAYIKGLIYAPFDEIERWAAQKMSNIISRVMLAALFLCCLSQSGVSLNN